MTTSFPTFPSKQYVKKIEYTSVLCKISSETAYKHRWGF